MDVSSDIIRAMQDAGITSPNHIIAESDQNKIKAMLKAELRNAMEAMGSA